MSGGWKYAAASVIGTSHLKTPAGECQDSYSVGYDADRDLFVCAVSDGAGSAAHSSTGSRIASSLSVELALSAPNDLLWTEDFARGAAGEIRNAISAKAEEMAVRLRDFACTLLVAVVQGPRAMFWQIGDGAICFRRRGNENFDFAFWPAKGEYANVTEFLTDERFAEELEIDSSAPDLVDLAIFSDGLERLALDFGAGEPHTKFFAGLFPYLYAEEPGRLVNLEQQLEAFLSSERVNAKTDDDKTLVLATTEKR